jgi:redox-sensitive bicupin YhaK (pirin superfamily)
MNQDAEIWACRSAKNKTHALELSPGRKAWVQLVSGEIELNGDRLTAGDGAAIESETSLKLKGLSEANELLVFNLPP